MPSNQNHSFFDRLDGVAGTSVDEFASAPLLPAFKENNKINAEDRGVHGWYRFVLSFPPHTVRDYITRWKLKSDAVVLDPFSGTGTTLVECKKLGVASVGLEASPLAYFASRTKLAWGIDSSGMLDHASRVASAARKSAQAGIACGNLRVLEKSREKLLIKNSISPLPLHRLLELRDCIDAMGAGQPFLDHERLALAKIAVAPSSNLRFGPEVGVGPLKADAPVIDAWLKAVAEIAYDLKVAAPYAGTPGQALLADARDAGSFLEPASISAVFTSPPYPNEKDYSRTTRLETTLLGFANDKSELQAIKRTLMRSNTRNVYKGDDDDHWIKDYPSVNAISDEIERRRIEQNKTSGFEKLYAKVTRLYFGGMARHLAGLRHALIPGAMLGYVVGDQASYLRVKIKTGELLAEIAGRLGYEVVSLDLFRTRLSTATGEMLREEVLVLRWPKTV